eukprot:12067-Heterococcus_DN1.PRE.1
MEQYLSSLLECLAAVIKHRLLKVGDKSAASSTAVLFRSAKHTVMSKLCLLYNKLSKAHALLTSIAVSPYISSTIAEEQTGVWESWDAKLGAKRNLKTRSSSPTTSCTRASAVSCRAFVSLFFSIATAALS